MLDHIRVLDVTDGEGLFCGYLLAQLGADVILVEPDAGLGARRHRHFVVTAYGRGRRSVRASAVDVAALARTADVVVSDGSTPLDLDALRRADPALVTVALTPFGSTGPKAGWAACDLTIVAAGGQMALSGDADRAPVRISEPQAFLHAAAEGAFGALIALAERAVSGAGQHVDVSAQQCVLQATQTSMLASAVGGALYTRWAGGVRVGPYSLRFVYPALDGHVSITFLFGAALGPYTSRLMHWVHEAGFCNTATRDLDWVSFFELIFSGRLDPARLVDALAATAAFTASRTKAELAAGAVERRLLLTPVATTVDVLASEQLDARGYWDLVDGVRVPGPFAKATGTPLRHLAPAPAPGAHDAAVAAELAGRRAAGADRHGAGAGPHGGAAAPDAVGGAGRRALDGLKVLDLSWAVAAPMATRVLADHGATVVRVETQSRPDAIRTAGPYLAGTPGGYEDTAQWHSVNAGKYGVQLNLGVPEGRAVVEDLVRWADVVVEAFTPGTMAGWGLGYERVAALNPSVVMVSSCLMGQTGPLAAFAGYGNLAAAVSGFTEVTGWPDRAPAGPFLAYTDYTSPRLTLVAMLGALEHRRRTGEGQHIDFSQAEGALQFLAPAIARTSATGEAAPRRGNADPHMAPHGVFPAAGDDRWVAVACRSDAEWAALSSLVGRGDLAGLTLAERLARADELDALVAAWAAPQEPEALQELLQAHGVAAHQVQNSPECVADPQLAHRNHFRRVPHAIHGETVVEGPHLELSRTPPGPRWGGPTLGQHTDEVLRGFLGYDDEHVTALVVAGAVE